MRRLLLALAALCAAWAAARAQSPGLGASVELVDPHAFRVCADPRDLPFSDTAHAGFEDKLAELFARKLNRPVLYSYFPRGIGFVRSTLNALRCDVIMGDALGDDLVQPTNPYYETSYVLVYRRGTGLDGVDTIEDKRLQGKHIGVVAGTPPAFLLVQNNLMADAKPYPLMVDTRYDSPSKDMVDDLIAGRIDAALLWGPLGGYYARQSSTPLTVVPLLKEHGVPLTYRIGMGVRHSDQNWKRTLNRLIAENRDSIDALLASYGVPLLDSQGRLIIPPAAPAGAPPR
jgi:quinoprotein dehydrogenase-associated probable ABC transporter substrate-binding protein